MPMGNNLENNPKNEPRNKPVDNRKRVRRQAWTALLLLAAGCAVAVAASWMTHLRSDWTEGKVYTLSDSTRAVLASLDEPVMVHAYITRDLPQPYGRLRRFIEDMLIAYHAAGGGKFGYEIVDPADDPNVAASLAARNIPRVQVQAVENDKAEVKQGYLAIVVEYLNRKEVIPVVRGEDGFEYLLTRKIKKVSGKGQATIGVASGFGARGLAQLRRLQQLAGDDYHFVEVTPDTQDIPNDVKALIVAGVSQAPSESFRYRIDQFRMQGKGVLVLAGNAEPRLDRGFEVDPIPPSANAWLKEDDGIDIEPGLVLDRYAARVMVNQRQGMFMMQSAVDYPFVVQTTSLDAGQPVTRGLE
ncbi:MAG TPA: GldG family protein, partial [Mariprofundaceae bacterium]|nr:GldG family protein [Mariprofundaceae bacterium]